MEFSTPRHTGKINFRNSPFPSPGNMGNYKKSPEFTPLSYSSPIAQNRYKKFGNKNQRYFNNSESSFSSDSNSFFSPRPPNNKRRYWSRKIKGNSYSDSDSDISLFVHPSMLEDPWAEFETENEKDVSNEVSTEDVKA